MNSHSHLKPPTISDVMSTMLVADCIISFPMPSPGIVAIKKLSLAIYKIPLI